MSSSTSGNFIAALASFFVPGLGQLIQGRIIAALVFFVVSVGLWFFFLVGLGISWLVSKPPFGGADSRSSGKRDGCGALKLCLSGIRTGIAVETALRTLSGAAAEGVIVRCSFGGSFAPPQRTVPKSRHRS
jgi:TM2 domain-containing membrane protein YozV